MASSLVDAKTEDLTEEKNTEKTEDILSTSASWKTNPSCSHTGNEPTLYLEDIQIHLLDENEKDQSVDGHGTP